MAANAQPQSEEGMPLSFSGKEVINTIKVSKSFKVHFAIALGLNLFLFLTWFVIALAVNQWPWFIYFICTFVFTLSFHFYILIRPKELLQLHVVWFLTLNAMLFITWLASQRYFPWFIFTFFAFGFFLLLHWTLRYHPSNRFRLHLNIFILFQLMFFFIWVTTTMAFPWFVIVFLAWGVILALHYWKRGKDNSSELPFVNPTQPSNPNAPQVPPTYTLNPYSEQGQVNLDYGAQYRQSPTPQMQFQEPRLQFHQPQQPVVVPPPPQQFTLYPPAEQIK